VSTAKVVKGYRLDKPLGAGGMGSVYVAEKLATHQSFAVKFMQDALVSDPSYVVRFEREISALRAIRHPNVVDVFDWNLPTPGGQEPPFVVMELLDGEGLDRLLKRKPILPVGMSVEIILQVLDGLAAAHAVGVIHRDLGPSNVFLEPQPGGKFRAKILDFGLARPIGEEGAQNVTQAGTLMGKPAYVAPELFGGGSLDARSDLFACGIILYRMLTGRFPYRQTDSQMLWVERYSERDQGKEYSSPRVHNAEIPASLDAVVAKAIRQNPDERYSSAREMQQALLAVEEDILDGQATVLIQPSPPPLRAPGETASSTVVGRSAVSMGAPVAQRRWMPVVAAAVAITAAVVVAVVIFVLPRNGAQQNPAVAPAADAPSPGAGPAPPVAAELVHLVVFGPPPDSIVSVGDVVLRGDPPEGDVPKSAEEVDLVVAAQGYQTYRGKVVPDRHKTTQVQLTPIATTTMDLSGEEDAGAGAPDAGASEAAPVAADAGALPPPRDAGRPPPRDARVVVPPRDAGTVAAPADAAAPPVRDTATPPRDDAGSRPLVDVSGSLPEDPFANARRLPQEAPF
jgi:serine/threonine-protein kinase